MGLAYVCTDAGVPVFGRKGASVHVQEVVAALRRRGIEVALFATRVDGDPTPRLNGVRVHPLPRESGPEPRARERCALAANVALATALRREGPFDLVYERHALWSFAAMEHARAARIPGLLEVNAPLIEEQTAHRVLIDRAGAEAVARRSFGAAAAILAVSTEAAAFLESFPEAGGKTHVVPNAVDAVRFRPGIAAAHPARPEIFTVGFVGSLKAWHGLGVLVEAFAVLHRRDPRTRLLVVGDGPEAARLRSAVSGYGLDTAVVLTGAVDPDEVPGVLAAMDAAVAPYPDLPGFYFSPMKLYEYLAMGLPVVASRVGQIAQVIQDGHNGLLCRPGDVRELAAALEQLRADRALRMRLGRAARKTILQGRTWDAVAERLLAIADQARAGMSRAAREIRPAEAR